MIFLIFPPVKLTVLSCDHFTNQHFENMVAGIFSQKLFINVNAGYGCLMAKPGDSQLT